MIPDTDVEGPDHPRIPPATGSGMTGGGTMKKRQKGLREAIRLVLLSAQGELLEQFPEFTMTEIIKAIVPEAKRLVDEAWREAERARQEAQMAQWKTKNPVWLSSHQKIAEWKTRSAIIEAGYRALAAKTHPDIGGDAAAMQRLNAEHNKLRKMLGHK